MENSVEKGCTLMFHILRKDLIRPWQNTLFTTFETLAQSFT